MKRIMPLLMTAMLALAACTSATADTAAGVLFLIIKPDGSTRAFTVEDLNALPLAQVSVDGKVEEGPLLLDVLTSAGVTEFNAVALAGSSAPVTLTRAQVDDNTILDLTNRGTLKLATTYVPKPEWTKDITTITVK